MFSAAKIATVLLLVFLIVAASAMPVEDEHEEIGSRVKRQWGWGRGYGGYGGYGNYGGWGMNRGYGGWGNRRWGGGYWG